MAQSGSNRVPALLVLALLLVSCSGGGGGSPAPSPPSNLSYAAVPVLTVGQAMSPLTPTVSGTVTSYGVQPALPSGLALSTSTGVISGTPAAASAAATYTVTASNSGGNASTGVAISVEVPKPMFSYGGNTFTLLTGLPANLTPTNSGGTATRWSVSPALPAGLTFNTADGTITGTPAVTAAAASYTVTAGNSTGTDAVTLMLTVESGVLLDVGHADMIVATRLTASRALTLDIASHWVLWDYMSAANLGNGSASCRTACAGTGVLAGVPKVDLAGSTVVIETSAALELRSAVDGSLLGGITAPIAWWKLATDGSYIASGNSSTLSVWSPAGVMMASRPGDYSKALAYAAPGEVRIALGPAGANVVETVTLPAGTSTKSPAFLGQFNTWFLDGQRFLTNTGNTVWTYSSAAVQQDLTAVPTIENLTGQGAWFWTAPSDGIGTLILYKVGASATPAASYVMGDEVAIGSGSAIGLLEYGVGSAHVVDLSGSTPTLTDYTVPNSNLSTFGAVSSSHWLLGTRYGVLVDGPSLAGTPRYFGYGAPWSIAGSQQRAAIATASGAVLSFSSTTQELETTIDFLASQVQLSQDGTVLAAAGDENDAQYHDDWSIRIYSLPAGSLTFTFPYTFTGGTVPVEMTLSASGTVLGQGLMMGLGSTSLSCGRQATAVTGGAPIWSEPFTASTASCADVLQPIRISDDNTLIAAGNTKDQNAATNIYNNGMLATAVPGWAVAWLDNTHILLNNYTGPPNTMPVYSGSTVYDASGVQVSAPALPQLGTQRAVQVLSADSVYDPSLNSIFSVSTGMPTWTSASPNRGVGAVAGARVVFASGNLVLTQPF
jgi:hypothetical protein